MNREFFFYKSYVTDVEGYFTETQYREYIDAIIHYGVTGTYHIGDSSILPAFMQRKASIDSSLMRYKRAVINGKKGGRKRAVTKAEIINALMLGVSCDGDIEDLAKYFRCSERTILRRFNRKELEELIEMAGIRRHVQGSNRYSRYGSKYDQFLFLCDVYGIKNDYGKYFTYLPRHSNYKPMDDDPMYYDPMDDDLMDNWSNEDYI